MKLTANVRSVAGLTTHLVVEHGDSSQLAPANTVEISASDVGFLLIRHSAGGFAGDTWHANVEEAKQQAEAEFAISPADWREEPRP
jgi:hypothetical protein